MARLGEHHFQGLANPDVKMNASIVYCRDCDANHTQYVSLVAETVLFFIVFVN